MSRMYNRGMKITPADIAFSRCCRERSQHLCEYCNKEYPDNARGLQCCHFQGRGAWATRFEPFNAFSLCYGHHVFLDSRKGTFAEFFIERRGQEAYNLVIEKSENTQLAKAIKMAEKSGELAAFYRVVYADMLRKRAGGVIGWMEFTGWL